MSSRDRDSWTAADQRHYKALRGFVLERDDHACVTCGTRTRTIARADFDGSSFDPENLRAECRSCIGHRAHTKGNPVRRPYPTPETITRPDGPVSRRQAYLIRQLGSDPAGLTRAEAAALIPRLLESAEAVAS